MTVLLLTEIFPPCIGGSSRWLWELYRRMPTDAVVVAAAAMPGDAAVDHLQALHIERLPLTFADFGIIGSASLVYARAALALRGLMRRRDPSVIHCGRVLPEGWLAVFTSRPFACYVHGEDLLSYATSRQLTWMARRVLRRAAALIANSDHTAALLRRDWRVDANRIIVLRPGVDTARFTPAPGDAAVRSALGWNDRLVVLTVARLQRRKGHDRMIEAVGRLRGEFPDLLYAVVGDGAERAALAVQVRQAGLGDHVRFHGAVDDADLVRCYQQCDLFVLPNRTIAEDVEGFGMVLLEAQACGRAVLAGNSGGTAEALRDGVTGVIADCSRTESLAAAIAPLLRDPDRRGQLGAAARRWTVETFDFDRNASRTAAALHRAVPR